MAAAKKRQGTGPIHHATQRRPSIEAQFPAFNRYGAGRSKKDRTIDDGDRACPAFNEGPGVVDPVVRTAVELREVTFPLHDPRAPGRVFNPGRKIAGIPPKEEARSSIVGRATVFEDSIKELAAGGREIGHAPGRDDQTAVPDQRPRQPVQRASHGHGFPGGHGQAAIPVDAEDGAGSNRASLVQG